MRRYICGHIAVLILFIIFLIVMIVKSVLDYPNWLVNGNNFEAYEIVVYANGLTPLVILMFVPIIISYALVGLKLAFGNGILFLIFKEIFWKIRFFLKNL